MDEKQINSFATKHWIATGRMITQIFQNTYPQGMGCFKATGKKRRKKTPTQKQEVKRQKGSKGEDTSAM